MKIIYTIAGFYRAAGMERILSDKANYLAGKGYDILIVTTEQRGRPAVFPLDSSIRMRDLNINYEEHNGGPFFLKFLLFPLKRFRHRSRLKALLKEERPDVTVSMFCGDEGFLPGLPYCGKTVLEVHFSRFKRLQYERKGIWALADRYRFWEDGRICRKFDRFVALTREDLDYWGNPQNGVVIPNFISAIPRMPSDLESRIVLAVGRYCHQKGFDRLLHAWSIVDKKLPSGHGWTLRLVGDGEDRSKLERLVQELGIAGSTIIDRPQKDMDSVYRTASLLAMSSRYEGFGLVLAEAQAYGIPAVSFDCKCGPRDIITNGEDGFLIPEGDVAALANGIHRLVNNDLLRRRMGVLARKHANRWDKEVIMQRWRVLFETEL